VHAADALLIGAHFAGQPVGRLVEAPDRSDGGPTWRFAGEPAVATVPG
jgi:hypothetical protein